MRTPLGMKVKTVRCDQPRRTLLVHGSKLKNAQKKADEILNGHLDKLELIAQRLLEKETIGQQEFADLMGGADPDVLKEDAEIHPNGVDLGTQPAAA